MFRRRFNQLALADQIKGRVPHRRLPAAQGVSRLQFAHLVHDVLPGARGQRGVAVHQINLRELQIHGGLAGRLIFCFNELAGLVRV